MLWGSSVNLGSFGVSGVRRPFSLCSPMSTLHIMIIRLIHDDCLETLYLCCGVKCQYEVIWGQKVVFSNSTMLHIMTIRLIHVSQIETLFLYILWGQMSMWGNFGVTGATVSRSVYRSS